MRTLVLVAAISLTGCATSRTAEPAPRPGPGLLVDVNERLRGTNATLYLTNGTAREGRVVVGPDSTVFVSRRNVRRRLAGTEEVYPTSAVERVEIDASLDTARGAGRGAGYGSLPGLALLGVGLVGLATCSEGEADLNCLGPGLAAAGGAVLTLGGALLGAGTGAALTSGSDIVAVYRSPITRYPDAVEQLEGAAADSTATTPPNR